MDLLQLTGRPAVTEKPAGAWDPQQVVDYGLPRVEKGDFCQLETSLITATYR